MHSVAWFLIGLGIGCIAGIFVGVWMRMQDEHPQGFPKSRRFHR